MPARREVELPLEGPDGGDVGCLRLRLRPRREQGRGARAPLLDERGKPSEDALAPVRLLESEEYRYEVEFDPPVEGDLRVEPVEMFDPDVDAGTEGRLRPGLHTGLLPVVVAREGGDELGRTALEVCSRKLDYREHYRWMLRDLAEGFAELLMQRFAPTRQRFEVDPGTDARTLYQRFAFLRSLVESEVFDGAIQQVLRRPYRTWRVEDEHRRPGQGMPATSAVARQLAGPGPRTDAGPLGETLGLETVPRRLAVARSEETRDNVPNRFVRFAFERWRDVVAQIHELLEDADASSPVERGRRECQVLLDRLDGVLAQELFRSCGRLHSFPAGNQVLQKREGYRSIFRAYVQFEAAAQLSWRGGEDVYGAGQRDVATLYEYWVYYALGREIADLCDRPFDFGQLVQASDGGLTLRLQRGKRQLLTGKVQRLGRRLTVELWFNRTFSATSDPKQSWTADMRPDCSLRIGSDEDSFFHDEVWLHFDAKYRLDRLKEALGGEEDEEGGSSELEDEDGGSEPDSQAAAKRADLLKMHAYRDAIRRSSGAYVVYPGDERAEYRQYHELLPGLGAFPLRPTQGQRPQGAASVRRFVDRVLDQVALQTSQHERARYWEKKSYAERREPESRVEAAPFLEEPPADSRVLLGYVKGEEHHGWIRRKGRYNLRVGDRTGGVQPGADALAARYLLLYGRGPGLPALWRVAGEPQLAGREELQREGYPEPGGEQYFLLRLGAPLRYDPLEAMSSVVLEDFHRRRSARPRGWPLVVRWKELVEGIEVLSRARRPGE